MNGTEPPPNATQRFQMPRLSMILATSVATVATYSAYLAMVKFGVNVLGMDVATSMVTSGVFELLLFTVAILAREAAQDGRPNGVLLFLTWLLSSASGFFAAWDEIYLGHPWAAALFRFCIPLGAALGWHLALIGHRHLAAGLSWGAARRLIRMQRFYEAVEAALRAADSGSRWKIDRAQRRLIRARSRARRVVQPTHMRDHTQAWADSDQAIVSMAEGARTGHNRITVALLGTNATLPELPNATERDEPDSGNGTPNATLTVTTPTLRVLPPVNATQPADAATLNATDDQPDETPAPASKATLRTAQRPANETEPAPAANATERNCKGCGKPLPAGATARAQYCIRFKTDGSRDQACKNAFNARRLRDAGEALERAINPGPAFA